MKNLLFPFLTSLCVIYSLQLKGADNLLAEKDVRCCGWPHLNATLESVGEFLSFDSLLEKARSKMDWRGYADAADAEVGHQYKPITEEHEYGDKSDKEELSVSSSISTVDDENSSSDCCCILASTLICLGGCGACITCSASLILQGFPQQLTECGYCCYVNDEVLVDCTEYVTYCAYGKVHAYLNESSASFYRVNDYRCRETVQGHALKSGFGWSCVAFLGVWCGGCCINEVRKCYKRRFLSRSEENHRD